MTEAKSSGWSRVLTPLRLDRPDPLSLAKGGLYSTAGLLAQGVLRFVTAVLVGRIAGKAELGVVAPAIATATILALLWPTSAGSAASKFLSRARGADDRDGTPRIAAHLRTSSLVGALVLGLAAVPVWVLVDGGEWSGAVWVGALTVAYSGYAFTRGVQFGVSQVPRATAWDIASVLVGLTGLLVMLGLGVRGPALVVPLVLAYGLYTVAGWPWSASGRPERALRREIDGFVVLGVVGTLASTGFLQLSQIVAVWVGGKDGSGLYAAALSLATPASMLAASLSLVLLPSMAQVWGRGDRAAFLAQTDQATRALAVVMVAVFGTIIVCSGLLIDLVWEPEFAPARDILPILVAAVLATNLAVGCVNSLATRSHRAMRVATAASVTGIAVGVGVWAAVAPALGITGVAVGYLCGTSLVAAIVIGVVWRIDRHRWAGLFAKVALGLLVIGAIAVAQRVWGLPAWLDPVFALAFLAGWGLLNRKDFARLPIPWPGRRR